MFLNVPKLAGSHLLMEPLAKIGTFRNTGMFLPTQICSKIGRKSLINGTTCQNWNI